MSASTSCCFFFFNDTATTEIYTLSLHDALPISMHHHAVHTYRAVTREASGRRNAPTARPRRAQAVPRSESTRLNSSHLVISYAVFCLKKKKSDTAVHAITITYLDAFGNGMQTVP